MQVSGSYDQGAPYAVRMELDGAIGPDGLRAASLEGFRESTTGGSAILASLGYGASIRCYLMSPLAMRFPLHSRTSFTLSLFRRHIWHLEDGSWLQHATVRARPTC